MTETPFVAVRAKYLGACEHKWEGTYSSFRASNGGKGWASRSVSFEIPVSSSLCAEDLAKAVELLPTVEMRRTALSAICDERNLTAWLAVGALRDFKRDITDFPNLDVAAWWRDSSRLFIVINNVEKAEAELERLRKDERQDLEFTIEQCAYSIDQKRRRGQLGQ